MLGCDAAEGEDVAEAEGEDVAADEAEDAGREDDGRGAACLLEHPAPRRLTASTSTSPAFPWGCLLRAR